MAKFYRILGLTLAVTATVCIGFSFFREGQDPFFLPVGLLCNSLALLLFLLTKPRK